MRQQLRAFLSLFASSLYHMTAVVCVKAVRCLKGKLKQRGDWAGMIVNTVPSVFPRELVLGMTFVMIRKTGFCGNYLQKGQRRCSG